MTEPCSFPSDTSSRISVITVVRNAPAALRATIESVRSQTGKNLEYLLVDGASTDETISVIREHEAAIDRWISEPDDGIYDAMNKGVRLAAGGWVHFLNAGDTFASADVCREAAEHLDPVAAFCYGDVVRVRAGVRDPVRYPEEVGREFLLRSMVCHQAIFARRDVLQELSFDRRFPIAADLDWALRAVAGGRRARRIPLVTCEVSGGGVSDSEGWRVFFDQFRARRARGGGLVGARVLLTLSLGWLASLAVRGALGRPRYYRLRRGLRRLRLRRDPGAVIDDRRKR